jgi:LPXTG-site transpeptidase (sortase) family protein
VLPSHLQIPAIDLDLSVQNPTTKDLGALDALLADGPARYVDSATLGEAGTMIIFAHSSHLPIVHNKMYQAFNKVPDLKAGDSITLTGEDGVRYLYSVSRVYKADAESTSIDMSPSLGTRLVLVTCDTLTGKSARFVLEAQLVGTI